MATRKKPLKKADFMKLSAAGKKAVSKLAKKVKTKTTKRKRRY